MLVCVCVCRVRLVFGLTEIEREGERGTENALLLFSSCCRVSCGVQPKNYWTKKKVQIETFLFSFFSFSYSEYCSCVAYYTDYRLFHNIYVRNILPKKERKTTTTTTKKKRVRFRVHFSFLSSFFIWFGLVYRLLHHTKYCEIICLARSDIHWEHFIFFWFFVFFRFFMHFRKNVVCVCDGPYYCLCVSVSNGSMWNKQ